MEHWFSWRITNISAITVSNYKVVLEHDSLSNNSHQRVCINLAKRIRRHCRIASFTLNEFRSFEPVSFQGIPRSVQSDEFSQTRTLYTITIAYYGHFVIIGSFLSPNSYISHKFTSLTSTDTPLLLKFFSGPINVRSNGVGLSQNNHPYIPSLDTILLRLNRNNMV